MNRTTVALIIAALAVASAPVEGLARGYGSHHRAGSYAVYSATSATVARDSHGRIKRSRAERDAFERANPCPATGRSYGARPGYVVDHVIALKRGGPDTPSNMQWQTREAAKAKDKVE